MFENVYITPTNHDEIKLLVKRHFVGLFRPFTELKDASKRVYSSRFIRKLINPEFRDVKPEHGVSPIIQPNKDIWLDDELYHYIHAKPHESGIALLRLYKTYVKELGIPGGNGNKNLTLKGFTFGIGVCLNKMTTCRKENNHVEMEGAIATILSLYQAIGITQNSILKVCDLLEEYLLNDTKKLQLNDLTIGYELTNLLEINNPLDFDDVNLTCSGYVVAVAVGLAKGQFMRMMDLSGYYDHLCKTYNTPMALSKMNVYKELSLIGNYLK